MDKENDMNEELIFDQVQTTIMQCAAQMKSYIENSNLRDTLKCCSEMIAELGNPMLNTKFYYIACK